MFFGELNTFRGFPPMEWTHHFFPSKTNQQKNLLSHVENSPTFSLCLVVTGYRSLRCKCADRGHTLENKWATDLKGAFAKEWVPCSASDWLRLVTVSRVNFRFQHKEG